MKGFALGLALKQIRRSSGKLAVTGHFRFSPCPSAARKGLTRSMKNLRGCSTKINRNNISSWNFLEIENIAIQVHKRATWGTAGEELKC